MSSKLMKKKILKKKTGSSGGGSLTSSAASMLNLSPVVEHNYDDDDDDEVNDANHRHPRANNNKRPSDFEVGIDVELHNVDADYLNQLQRQQERLKDNQSEVDIAWEQRMTMNIPQRQHKRTSSAPSSQQQAQHRERRYHSVSNPSGCWRG
jgi:hypothetical protein|eukprot:g5280.t1 g5280   contig2:152669-153121(+)